MAPVKNYTPHQMGLAIEAVRRGENVSSAAKKYGVPRITLRNKITGKSPAICSMGPPSVLNNNEEAILVQWLFAMSDRHCPVAKEQLLDSVQLIIKSDGRETPFTDGRPGRKWYQAFLKRHPEVSERLSQNLTSSREAVTQDQICKWFSEIQRYFEENNLEDILKDPTRIFNTDESAFFLNPNPGHVLVKKGDKNVYSISGNEKENLTVLMTANAEGIFAPPMIVFAYERIPKQVSDSVPETWGIGKSENGWMCSSTFYEYITNIFHPWLIQNKIKLPVIFFLDGHASHLTKHLSDFCSQNKIEIIALYPNSTHLLQPMDLAVFRPLKAFWRKHVRKWKTEHLGQQVKKDNFAPILKKAIEDLTPDCVKNGFKAGGLFPFGPDYIDFTKMHTHNRRSNANQPTESQDSEFFAKLEQEIVNTFNQAKLNMYKRCFYISRTALNDELPPEDLTLYTIWAKHKNLFHSYRKEVVESELENAYLSNTVVANEIEEIPLIQGSIDLKSPSKPLLSTLDAELIPTANLTDTNNDRREDHKLIEMTHKTPLKDIPTTLFTDEKASLKDMPSTSFAEHMLKDKNIIVPSPFKKALFWPESTTNKRGRLSKEKLPAAITSKAWKEFHEKKELDKIAKEKEKEKRKQERLHKKLKKAVESKNKNQKNIDKPKTRKRRQISVTSSDTEDSDITYAETGESDIEVKSDVENDKNSKNTCMITKKGERSNENRIQILESVDLQMVLDEKTGSFNVISAQSQQPDKPEVGNYVLVKFDGKDSKKNYRYVCIIQNIFEESKIVVQGLRSRKSRKTFRIIENDVSIIEQCDILSYLPEPVVENNNFVFPCVIDVKELI